MPYCLLLLRRVITPLTHREGLGGGSAGAGGGCCVSSIHNPSKPPIDVEPCSYDATDGDGHDEEHGVLALRQVLHGSIQSDGQAHKAQSGIENALILFLMPRCSTDPMMVPAMMVHVLTIVPIISI